MTDLIFGNLGLEAIRTLQSFSNPLLDLFFIIITNLGSELFYVAIVVVIFAAIDKKVGFRLALYLLITGLAVSVLKGLVSWLRPYQAHEGQIRNIYEADGFSFPSGHAQSSGAFWTGLFLQVRELKKDWATPTLIISALMIFLVGLSRIYLGVHYPSDVLVGWLIGIFITYVLYKYEKRIMEEISARLSLIGQVIGVVVISIIVFILYLSIMMLLSKDIVVGDISNYIGLIIGVTTGYLLEEEFVQYEPPTRRGYQVVAALMAIGVALGAYVALALIFPSHSDPVIHVLLRGFRYLFLGFLLILGIPFILKKIMQLWEKN